MTRPRGLAPGVLLLCALLAAGCAHVPTTPADRPANIILMIGDGMGVAHVTTAKVEGGTINMERLPVGGLVTTYAEGSFVTDSAASGTAIATGMKTTNGTISQSPSGERYKTALEYAEESGLSTGLVATCSVTHATPASFAAHVDERDKHFEIAEQMAASGVDVLFGGGWSFFLPTSESGGGRKDGVNLLDVLRERMPVAMSVEEFEALPDDGAAAALFAREHPGRASDREPTLAALTKKAIELLSGDEDGFFLMVEGSQIDWASHENDEEWLVEEILDFDAAVGAAMDFAERDGETLVIVTADHETGGYTLRDASIKDRKVTWWKFESDNHTGSMVPLLAFGPGSSELGGIRDNTSLGRVVIGHVRTPRN
ncbi:MAG: alkaline phosphatase [Candidatus Eisenbacteria bacterium]